MIFDEIQFSTKISLGARSLSRRKVDIVRSGSGYEFVDEKWKNSLRTYDVSLGIRDLQDVKNILAFWEARGGRARAFRFKDWADYEANSETLYVDGSPTVQLTRTYSSSNQSYVRDIKKPVQYSFERNDSSYSPASVDDTTGIVTLSKDKDLSISNVTASSPAEVTTSSNHGFSGGETVWIINTGLSEIDDQTWKITVIDIDTVSLDGSDTSGTGGSSSGSLQKFVQPGEKLTWTGEFDVPVRFENNNIQISVDLDDLASIPEIPLVEIRL